MSARQPRGLTDTRDAPVITTDRPTMATPSPALPSSVGSIAAYVSVCVRLIQLATLASGALRRVSALGGWGFLGAMFWFYCFFLGIGLALFVSLAC